MANYRKSFNFRNGVQVDNDKFLVDARGNVGVGTSAPNRPLDVYGTARINGLLDTTTLKVSSGSTFQSLVTVGSSIFLNPTTGIITAVSYRGDGTQLAGVIAIATDGWVKSAGTLSTSFNVYQGPFINGDAPVAVGPLQVGIGSTAFLIGFDGSVGIGTTIPKRTLEVRGGIGATTLVITGLSTFQNDVILGEYNLASVGLVLGGSSQTGKLYYNSGSTRNEFSGTNTDFYIRAKNYNFTTGASGFAAENAITITQDGSVALYYDNSKEIETTGYGATVYGTLETQQLNVTGTSTISVNSSSDAVRITQIGSGNALLVEDSANPDATPFVVNASGQVGIGTTNPTSLLRVSGSNNSTPVQIGAGNSASFTFSGDSSSVYTTNFNINDLGLSIGHNSSIRDFRLQTNSLPRITILGDGNVGVAITTPTEKLHVSGNILATGIITALTTFSGNLVGIATTALNLADGANITTGTINDARLPDIITSNLNRAVGITTLNKIRVETLGIGTETFTSDFAIIKDATTSLEVISRQGSANIGLGSEALGGNNTARIKYNPLTQVLDFDNNGSGEVNFHVHKGNGAVVGTQTGGFFFKTGSSAKVLLNLTYDGRVSVNESVPLLTDTQYSLMVNGNTKVRGRLDLDAGINAGISTFSSIVVNGNSTFATTQNFNTQSGISTFNQFRVTNSFNATGISSFAGITTFLAGVDIGNATGGATSPLKVYSPATLTNTTLGLSTSKIYYDHIGGVTTGFYDPRNQILLTQYQTTIPNNQILPFSGYGDIQIRSGGINIISQDYIAVHPSLASSETGIWPGLTGAQNVGMGLRFISNNLCKVGFNTLYIRSTFDVGYGNSANSSYLIPPRLSTSDIYYVSQLWNPDVAGPSAGNWTGHARANLATPDGLTSGGIVYDYTASQLKVAVAATTFCGVATYTNNHSGFGAFVPPTMTTTQRNTMTNAGIQSGAIIYNSTTDRLEVRLKGTWFGITTAV